MISGATVHKGQGTGLLLDCALRADPITGDKKQARGVDVQAASRIQTRVLRNEMLPLDMRLEVRIKPMR
jgi:hypothetical protein